MLTADQASEEAKKRIDAIASSNDGFKIAEQDLLLRGPGDFFGGLQHGLPALKIANPLRDIQVLERAQVASQKLIALDPGLDSPQARPVKEYLLTLPLAQPQRVGVAESG
jgi:ATP-dependent DNA helicase RecG